MATVLGTVDAGGDGKEVLLASLNYKLGKDFTLDDFEFSDPEPVAIPNPTHNTMIKFGPKAHSGYYGTKKIYYNRIHVSELGIIRVEKGTATRVSHLLQKVNQKYGILITELDIFDAILPELQPGQTEIEVDFDFRPTSVVYYGGTKIILGTNDPALIDPDSVSLPFDATWMFFSETIHNDKLDAYSVAIDKDKNRKRSAPTIVGEGDADLGLLYQRHIEPTEADEYFGHVVGSWKTDTDNGVKALNVYGHVLSRTGSALQWSKTGDLLGMNMTDPVAVNAAQVNRPFKFTLQSSDNSVYALQVDTSGILFKKSEDYGDNWTDLNITGFSFLTDHNNWNNNKIEILDKMHHGNGLWMLVRFKDSSNPLLSVIKIKDDDGSATTYDLHDKVIENTPIVLGAEENKYIKGSFVSTPDLTQAVPNVAILTSIRDSNVLEALICEFEGGNYTVRATAGINIFTEQKGYKGSFISAYCVSLEKDDTVFVDVIEIGTMVPTDEPNFELYVENKKLRTEQGFYGHGTVVLTSVRKGNQRNAWRAKNLKLGTGSYPQRIVFDDKGRRMHFVMQPEYRIQRVSLVEDNDIAGFVPEYDPQKSFSMESHTGYTNHSDHGIGLYEPNPIIETANLNYGMQSYSNAENALPNIGYSFITTTVDGKTHWLTAADTTTVLTNRSISPEYSFMGDAPVATFTIDNDIYMVASHGKGVYKRNHTDKNWDYYGSLNVSFKPSNETEYIGWSNIKLEPTDFKQFGLDPTTSEGVFRIKINKDIKVTDVATGQLSVDKTVEDEALVLVNTNTVANYPDTNLFRRVDAISGYGMNLASNDSPRRFKMLTIDPDGQWDYIADVTQTTEYDNTINNIDKPAGFPTDAEILDYRKDVKYLNIKALFYVKDGAVYKLIIQNNDDGLVEQDLQGGSDTTLDNFKPDVAFYLYEFAETNYVPLVYYSNKKIYLMGKVVEDGTFLRALHTLSIPSDNGSSLDAIPVFANNRTEYLLVQKGNGVFKINYTYDEATREATFNLVRLFSLSISGFENHTVVSAAVASYGQVTHPDTAVIPTYPDAGTLLSIFCDGTTKMGRYADGSGGYTESEIETNSADCGYVAPPPGTVVTDTVTISASTTFINTSQVEVTSVEAGEDGTSSFATYTFDGALADDVTLDISISYGTAEAADIASMKLQIGNGAEEDLTIPGTITIPAGQTEFKIKFTYVEDNTTEGDETFTVSVSKQAGDTHILNPGPIEVVFTILDTST